MCHINTVINTWAWEGMVPKIPVSISVPRNSFQSHPTPRLGPAPFLECRWMSAFRSSQLTSGGQPAKAAVSIRRCSRPTLLDAIHTDLNMGPHQTRLPFNSGLVASELVSRLSYIPWVFPHVDFLSDCSTWFLIELNHARILGCALNLWSSTVGPARWWVPTYMAVPSTQNCPSWPFLLSPAIPAPATSVSTRASASFLLSAAEVHTDWGSRPNQKM